MVSLWAVRVHVALLEFLGYGFCVIVACVRCDSDGFRGYTPCAISYFPFRRLAPNGKTILSMNWHCVFFVATNDAPFHIYSFVALPPMAKLSFL